MSYKHYIRIDSHNRIAYGFSTAFDAPVGSDICINGNGGYQFKLFENEGENPNLITFDGIPLYKWDGKEVVKRTEKEIAADRSELPKPIPNMAERNRADIDFLMLMGGYDV